MTRPETTAVNNAIEVGSGTATILKATVPELRVGKAARVGLLAASWLSDIVKLFPGAALVVDKNILAKSVSTVPNVKPPALKFEMNP